MSLLQEIIDRTKTQEFHEQPFAPLVLGYFNHDDWPERIKTWATDNGLSVTFSDVRNTCIFRAIQPHAIPGQPPQ